MRVALLPRAMTGWEGEVPRLARLARLRLDEAEAARLARDCERIAREFSALAEHAASLPPAPPVPPGPVREDVARPAPAEEVAGILAAAPRKDAQGRVVVPRGL